MALLLDSDQVCSEIWRGGAREAEQGLERWLVELESDRLQKCRGPTSPAWRALPFPPHPPQYGSSWPSRQPCSWLGTVSILIVKNGSSKNSSCYSVAQLCPTLHCSIPCLPVLNHLLEFAQTHVHQVDDDIQPSYPLSSLSPLAFNLSQRQVFSTESALPIRWPKYWSFSVSISPANEHSGLTSLRID